MLINNALGKSGKTYEDTIRKRIFISVILILLGLATFATALILAGKMPSDFIKGIYTGSGSGLAACGIGILVTNLRLLRNKEKMKEQETVERDERNSFLQMKSASSAYFFGVLGLYLAALGAGFFNADIMLVLFACCVGLLAICGIMYLIYSKKY
jgi:hypothetical protein